MTDRPPFGLTAHTYTDTPRHCAPRVTGTFIALVWVVGLAPIRGAPLDTRPQVPSYHIRLLWGPAPACLALGPVGPLHRGNAELDLGARLSPLPPRPCRPCPTGDPSLALHVPARAPSGGLPPPPFAPVGPWPRRHSGGLGFLPAPLHLWSHNVRGLNAPERRSHLLRSLWASRVSIAFLQETHFRGTVGPALRDSRYPVGYFANHPSAKKAGVAVLFASTVPFICEEVCGDPMGRYLFLRGSIADTKYTFGCIYAPNTRQHRFLRSTLHKLEQFREGLLVVAGDLNVALDPQLDTSTGASSLPTHCLRDIKEALRGSGLVD
ncbi:Hypothetical predicted protein [Pelobates cultripes]|uniref:exodeoxyribonuclease III n=1 Tax=Pelobates cultripes TaxID=61616 RepID=A0AAD1RHV1_PELCU|nr:Hypothetical predicted protein [Pelobates cultripes]